MKQTFLMVFGCLLTGISVAQETILERQAQRTKEKIEQRAENRIDRGVDKTLDKTEEKIDKVGKKEKNPKTEEQDKEKSDESTSDNSPTNGEGQILIQNSGSPSDSKNTGNKTTFNSKFDFVAGQKVIISDQFETTDIGDFPLNWNSNSSGEIVIDSKNGEKFLKLASQGVFTLEGVQNLPDNFTLEFDLITSDNFSEMQDGLKVFFVKKQEQPMMFDPFFNQDPMVGFNIHPSDSNVWNSTWAYHQDNQKVFENQLRNLALNTGKLHISFWRQNGRIRLYVNETKIWDLPKAFLSNVNYELLFATYTWEGDLMIGNLRLAEGQQDTRSLFETGRFTTTAIRFESGSDRLTTDSYGILKDIANEMEKSKDLNVKIVGHTDADGDEKSNLELSKKRAEAVKRTLVNEFKIDGSRLQTDGKGELEPTDPNTTAVGKANNRRVEFIKL